MAKLLTFDTDFVNPKANNVQHIEQINYEDITLDEGYVLQVIVYGKTAYEIMDESMRGIFSYNGLQTKVWLHDNLIEGVTSDEIIDSVPFAEIIGKINYPKNFETLKLSVAKKIIIAELVANGYYIDPEEFYLRISTFSFNGNNKVFLKLNKNLEKKHRYNIVAYVDEIFKKININFGLTDTNGKAKPGKCPIYYGYGFQLILSEDGIFLNTDLSYNNFFGKEVIYDDSPYELEIIIQK